MVAGQHRHEARTAAAHLHHDAAGAGDDVGAAGLPQAERISPAPAPRHTRAAARIRRAAVGWASASARNPAISAAVYGALARSRGSGRSAGSRCGTTLRARNRRFVRSVRRAGPDSPGAYAAKRSITEGCSSTLGTGSSPSGIAQSASLPAAHSRFFARSRPAGAAWVTTARANAAASGGTDEGCQAMTQRATSAFIQ